MQNKHLPRWVLLVALLSSALPAFADAPDFMDEDLDTFLDKPLLEKAERKPALEGDNGRPSERAPSARCSSCRSATLSAPEKRASIKPVMRLGRVRLSSHEEVRPSASYIVVPRTRFDASLKTRGDFLPELERSLDDL